MSEMVRFGDICGYDDAEAIDLDDNATLVIDLDDTEGSILNEDSE